MAEYFKLIVFVALLVSSVSATIATGNFIVYVKDADGNPVPNTTVDVIYYNGLYSPIMENLALVTDSNGEAATLLSARDDTNVTIDVYYNSTHKQVVYPWLNFAGSPVFISLPVEKLDVFVHDQKGRPLSGIETVVTNGSTVYDESTDAEGKILLDEVDDRYTYNASAVYGNRGENSTVGINGAWNNHIDILIPTYDLTIRTLDDQKNPLDADLEVDVHSISRVLEAGTGKNGTYTFNMLPLSEVRVKASWNNSVLSRELNLDADSEEEFLFHLTAPEITNVRIEPEAPCSETTIIDADINDNGNSGGVNATLVYSMNDSMEKYQQMKVVNSTTYRALVPGTDGKVSYKVVAVNNWNASNESSWRYYNQSLEKQCISSAISVQPLLLPLGLGIFAIVAILVILLIGAFAAWTIIRRSQVQKQGEKTESDGGQKSQPKPG